MYLLGSFLIAQYEQRFVTRCYRHPITESGLPRLAVRESAIEAAEILIGRITQGLSRRGNGGIVLPHAQAMDRRVTRQAANPIAVTAITAHKMDQNGAPRCV